jgi:hypothetical protein
VDVQRPKIAAKLFLLLNANVLEILVPEDHNPTLGNEKRKLVLLLVAQLGKLEAADLGADDRRQLRHLEVRVVLGQEVWLLLLGDQPPVVELKGPESGEMRLLVVNGEIGGVFVLWRS